MSVRFPKTGFTLLELLVTVSIISILAGLVIFAAIGGRDKARTATCVNTGVPEGVGTVDKYTIIDFPGDYHNDSLSSSFSDGHVERHVWRDFVKRTHLGSARPRISVGSETQDVKWLQDHSTYAR